MSFISYAQNYEDVLLWRALGSVGHGFYIDVGAFHPDDDSVTRAFHDRGWTGINIEPASSLFRRFASARPRDVNLRCAVGAAAGTTSLHVVHDTGLSTTDQGYAAALGAQGFASQAEQVEVRTLADICRAHAPADIHFLKIDVESAERAVLEGADFTRYRPWIVLLEAVAPLTRAPTHAEWEDLLLAAEYRFAWFDGLNRFYIAAEREAALRPCFAAPPNVFDDFIRPADTELARRLAEAQRTHDAAQAEATFAAQRAQASDARARDALLARADLRERLVQAQREGEELRATVEWRRGLQEAAEATAQRFRDEAAWRQGLQEELQQQLAALQAAAEWQSGLREDLQRQLASLRSVAEREAACAAEREAACAAEAARAEKAHGSARASTEAALARADAADAALAAVRASRSWQLTAPMRRLAGRTHAA